MKTKILVADDDRVLSQLVCSILGNEGHACMVAYDAMQTLMFAMRAPVPALIILDINMPGGTGIEALRKLKMSAKTTNIPVVVLSGSAEAGVADQVRGLGAEEYLAKPIDPDALVRAVRRALGTGEG
jgi:CheY-like chemotaxis protein